MQHLNASHKDECHYRGWAANHLNLQMHNAPTVGAVWWITYTYTRIIHIVLRGVTASVVVNHLYIIQPLSFCLLPPPLHAIGLFHITINFHTSHPPYHHNAQNRGLKDHTDKTISLTVSTYLIAFSFNLCKKYFLEAQTIVNDGLMVVGDNVQDDLLQTTVKDGLVAEQNRRRNRCALF